jgi:hypothetical protein
MTLIGDFDKTSFNRIEIFSIIPKLVLSVLILSRERLSSFCNDKGRFVS